MQYPADGWPLAAELDKIPLPRFNDCACGITMCPVIQRSTLFLNTGFHPHPCPHLAGRSMIKIRCLPKSS